MICSSGTKIKAYDLRKNFPEESLICRQINLHWKIPDMSADRISTTYTYFVHTAHFTLGNIGRQYEVEEEVVLLCAAAIYF
jgi:hypothetical protein